MITEDYVSFEIAKLLKEKGFNWGCIATYNLTTKSFAVEEIYQDWNTRWKIYISAPTHQMAMKWLEIKKHIAIIPVLISILDNEKFLWDVKIVIAETGEKYSQGWVYENREQACEAAIKYCLENLI